MNRCLLTLSRPLLTDGAGYNNITLQLTIFVKPFYSDIYASIEDICIDMRHNIDVKSK